MTKTQENTIHGLKWSDGEKLYGVKHVKGDAWRLPAYRVFLANGTSYVTSMARNVTLEKARAYFIGESLETTVDGGPETFSRCTKVEVAKTAHADKLAEACAAYVRARNDGGISMADLSSIADRKIREALAAYEAAQ